SEDELPWLGVCGQGGLDNTTVACSNEYAFVTSCDIAYFMCLKTKTLVYSDDQHFLADVTQTKDPEMFIANDYLAIHVYTKNGHLWNTPRISWDGFQNIMIEGNKVSGEAWSPIENKWLPFQIDLTNKSVIGGSYHEPT
ncbi:MAG: hypothetical protein ACYSUG_06565, partial [Planctomycetota bacterium]